MKRNKIVLISLLLIAFYSKGASNTALRAMNNTGKDITARFNYFPQKPHNTLIETLAGNVIDKDMQASGPTQSTTIPFVSRDTQHHDYFTRTYKHVYTNNYPAKVPVNLHSIEAWYRNDNPPYKIDRDKESGEKILTAQELESLRQGKGSIEFTLNNSGKVVIKILQAPVAPTSPRRDQGEAKSDADQKRS